jgi:hypothetical protein
MANQMRTLVALAVLAAAAVPAAAGTPEQCEDQSPPKQGTFHIEMIGGKRVMVIEPVLTICGKAREPSVAFVRTSPTIHYAWENLSFDIMPLILSSVQKAPF